jgi:hypothetical protein
MTISFQSRMAAPPDDSSRTKLDIEGSYRQTHAVRQKISRQNQTFER